MIDRSYRPAVGRGGGSGVGAGAAGAAASDEDIASQLSATGSSPAPRVPIAGADQVDYGGQKWIPLMTFSPPAHGCLDIRTASCR